MLVLIPIIAVLHDDIFEHLHVQSPSDHGCLHLHHQLHALPTLAHPPLDVGPSSSLHLEWLSVLQLCVRASQLVLFEALPQSHDALLCYHHTISPFSGTYRTTRATQLDNNAIHTGHPSSGRDVIVAV